MRFMTAAREPRPSPFQFLVAHFLLKLFFSESEKFAVPRRELRFQDVFKTAAHEPRPSPFQFWSFCFLLRLFLRKCKFAENRGGNR